MGVSTWFWLSVVAQCVRECVSCTLCGHVFLRSRTSSPRWPSLSLCLVWRLISCSSSACSPQGLAVLRSFPPSRPFLPPGWEGRGVSLCPGKEPASGGECPVAPQPRCWEGCHRLLTRGGLQTHHPDAQHSGASPALWLLPPCLGLLPWPLGAVGSGMARCAEAETLAAPFCVLMALPSPAEPCTCFPPGKRVLSSTGLHVSPTVLLRAEPEVVRAERLPVCGFPLLSGSRGLVAVPCALWRHCPRPGCPWALLSPCAGGGRPLCFGPAGPCAVRSRPHGGDPLCSALIFPLPRREETRSDTASGWGTRGLPF